MAAVELRDGQKEALSQMTDGCILCGGVGTGKSITSLAYYFTSEGGTLEPYPKITKRPKDLYIITTAQKRDTGDWEMEMSRFGLSTNIKACRWKCKVVVDSWNKIQEYKDVKGAFFIFDEDHVTGKGKWSKTFIKIAKGNRWIIASATPGDTWSDYIPVFVANGFFKNFTEFYNEHCVFNRFTSWPQITGYMNEGRLIRLRKKILVDIPIERATVRHDVDIWTEYDVTAYKNLTKTRWNPIENRPIETASELCQLLRRVVNMGPGRDENVLKLVRENEKVIIFYNYDYERDFLLGLPYGDDVLVAERSGHAHQDVPLGQKWVYLVQYNSGSEAWNCIRTNCIIFFSQSYSWRQMEQARGRIDRMNTPYTNLYYYIFKTRAPIDLAISRSLRAKKNFNEGKFYHGL